MRKIKYTSICMMACTLLALQSCEQSEITVDTDRKVIEVMPRLSGYAVETMTRAAATEDLAQGTQVRIFTVKSSDVVAGDIVATLNNATMAGGQVYTAGTNGTLTGVTLKVDGAGPYDFYALAPQDKASVNNGQVQLTHGIDYGVSHTANVTIAPGQDVVLDPLKRGESKLNFTVRKADNADAAITSIEVVGLDIKNMRNDDTPIAVALPDVPATAAADVNDKTISLAATDFAVSSGVYTATTIVLPKYAGDIALALSVKLNGSTTVKVYADVKVENVELKPGKQYNFELAINAQSIMPSLTITAWNDKTIDKGIGEGDAGDSFNVEVGKPANSYLINPTDYKDASRIKNAFYMPLKQAKDGYTAAGGTWPTAAISSGSWRIVTLWGTPEVVVDPTTDEGIYSLTDGDYVKIKHDFIEKQTVGSNVLIGLVKVNGKLDSQYGGTATETNDEILWSWHLWMTDYDPETRSGGMVHTYNGYDVMDRNLGATRTGLSTAWTTSSFTSGSDLAGMYYQYGRKDPFVISPSKKQTGGGTLIGSIQNPTTFILEISGTHDWIKSGTAPSWNSNTKTVFDPCPYGWTVPSPALWTGFTTDNCVVQGTGASFGRLYTGTSGVSDWYPVNGFIDYGNGGPQGTTEGDLASDSSKGLSFTTSSLNIARGWYKASGIAIRCVQKKN